MGNGTHGEVLSGKLIAGKLVAKMKRCLHGMDDLDSEWQRKGATLSDKTAREEFGLTQDEIVRAIRAGKLHYREGSMYGNPWLRLLRRDVEALVRKSVVCKPSRTIC